MIIIMEPSATKEQIEKVENRLEELGCKTHPIYGEVKTVIGVIGDKRHLDNDQLMMYPGVENIVPIMKPYKLASKEIQEKSIVKVGDVKIGGDELVVMAGPCAVEDKDDFFVTAHKVKDAGAKILRGGAFKPRTSPYSFQGLQEEGLKMLDTARKETGLKIVTEVIDTRDVETVAKYSDVLQIGARNMQNFRLLQEAGMTEKPVLLKRGLAATIEEWLMAAEYVMSEGNSDIILCERGIRTFETETRNTMDISAILVARELSHLPVVADPSHASGSWKYVSGLSKAAVAAGADGLIIEVHNDPATAMCDGTQSLKPDKFANLMESLKPIAEAVDRNI
ncbi:3-deoxy-7-phosphoheptulonate synthase [Natranaerofaba carboxydovora]|uniref:3-deoxy-7-phosphoheptulonate synthase n=1 Tax=Natranaerofaba carboxydovora TaxID=2742683 RepID=UPI001F1461E8|nr:3-deoxy-7-phosphoheptulonate synthase [Natranaerofaba carboxydovora]UMZ73659.1 Phospho-2-dehydro-3-deoxyheptonate aldolase [Natranaerofaba carboxydovora]